MVEVFGWLLLVEGAAILFFAQGVAFVMKEDKAFDPVDTALLYAIAIMNQWYSASDLLQQMQFGVGTLS